MVPVVTDEAMLIDTYGPWEGLIGGIVGGHLYIDLTKQTDTQEFEAKCDELAHRINAVKAEKERMRMQLLQQQP